jgi:hypothetical protein
VVGDPDPGDKVTENWLRQTPVSNNVAMNVRKIGLAGARKVPSSVKWSS